MGRPIPRPDHADPPTPTAVVARALHVVREAEVGTGESRNFFEVEAGAGRDRARIFMWPGQMSWIWELRADHLPHHVCLNVLVQRRVAVLGFRPGADEFAVLGLRRAFEAQSFA